MHLFLVRHGECLGQCDQSFVNHPDTSLSKRGEQEARSAAVRLRQHAITHVVSSPLVRALGTAGHIAESAGLSTVEVWLDLREGWLGAYRTFKRDELMSRFPRARLPESITEQGWTHPGDATYQAFFVRAQTVLQRIKDTFATEDRVAIVTHGGFANNLLHAILQISPETPQWFELANGSISHLRLVPDPQRERPDWPLFPPVHAEVLSINDVSHIDASELDDAQLASDHMT